MHLWSPQWLLIALVVQEEELNNALEQGVELTLPSSSSSSAQSANDAIARMLENAEKSAENAKTLTLAETKWVYGYE